MASQTTATNQTLQQAWEDPQNTPYAERYQNAAQIKQTDEKFPSLLFCLDCGFWVEDETHTCSGRHAA